MMRHMAPRIMVTVVWLACVLVLTSHALTAVSAQMSAYHMDMRDPDWTSERGIFVIAYFCITMPAFLVTLVLLWRRRKSYPIAGRGAWFIIAFNVNSLYGTPACLFAWLCFPESETQHTITAEGSLVS